jgi:hypothetical protein
MMELRILLERPAEPNTPCNGLVWYKDARPWYQVRLQYRNIYGWQDVEVERTDGDQQP